jgi:hypothetical protein
VGGSRDSVIQGFTQMLHFYSRPLFGGDRFADSDDLLPLMGGFTPKSEKSEAQSADRLIESKLRNVPLPEGLMVRLANLAVTLSDDATDQVDYLGC